MILTKKKALEISIELWEWLAETGSDNKEDWPGWAKYGRMECTCALCEYSRRQQKNKPWWACTPCPLYKIQIQSKAFTCHEFFEYWEWADDLDYRKKYAAFLLEVLKGLK